MWKGIVIYHVWLITGRPKRLLVIINPNSGKKKGIKVYQKSAAPLFKLCGVKVDVIGKCNLQMNWEIFKIEM